MKRIRCTCTWPRTGQGNTGQGQKGAGAVRMGYWLGKWQTCHALLLYPVILAFLCPSLSFVGNTKAFCISTRITDHQGTQDRKAAGKRRWRW